MALKAPGTQGFLRGLSLMLTNVTIVMVRNRPAHGQYPSLVYIIYLSLVLITLALAQGVLFTDHRNVLVIFQVIQQKL